MDKIAWLAHGLADMPCAHIHDAHLR